jgi:hypothetical protein
MVASTHKSLPTMFSSTELFPLDCDPTTAICGKSMGFWTWIRHQYEDPRNGGDVGAMLKFGRQQRTPTVVKTSCSLFTSVISPGSLTLMLYIALALAAARGCFGHVPTHSGLSP